MRMEYGKNMAILKSRVAGLLLVWGGYIVYSL